MIGPGKYDALATRVREEADAHGVILIVIGGERGSGFSVQGPVDLVAALPTILESVVAQIRADLSKGPA